MLQIVLLIVVIVVVGVGILAYRSRTEKGIESGITSFRRELSALAPRDDERPPRVERTEPPRRGVTVVGPDEADGAGDREPHDASAPDTDDADGSAAAAEAGDDAPTEPAPNDHDDGAAPDEAPSDRPASPGTGSAGTGSAGTGSDGRSSADAEEPAATDETRDS